jgi:hypothetical protein
VCVPAADGNPHRTNDHRVVRMDVGGLATTGASSFTTPGLFLGGGPLVAGRSLIVWTRRNRLEPASAGYTSLDDLR